MVNLFCFLEDFSFLISACIVLTTILLKVAVCDFLFVPTLAPMCGQSKQVRYFHGRKKHPTVISYPEK